MECRGLPQGSNPQLQWGLAVLERLPQGRGIAIDQSTNMLQMFSSATFHWVLDHDRLFARWSEPWKYAGSEETTARLRNAGFVDIHTEVVPAPVVFDGAASFREFVTRVIARPFLGPITDSAESGRFMTRSTELAAADSPPFELDYWRLNIEARRDREP